MSDSEIKKTIVDKLHSLINSEISKSHYKALTSMNYQLSDAVETQQKVSKHNPSFLHLQPDTAEGYILTSLGHISANPSNAMKKELLKKLYVYFSNSDPHEDEKNRYPNYNSSEAELFLDKLIESSKSELSLYKGNNKVRNVYILQGDRGTGKTCFINQLFTHYNDYLDGNNVIWIRINISDDFSDDNNPDISHWLLSKLTLVIFRYYLKNPVFSELLPRLKNYIESKPDVLKQKYYSNLEKITNLFYKQKRIEQLYIDTVDPALEKEVLDYVLGQNISLIYILDGFDRIEITPSCRDRFNNIRRRIGRLFNLDTCLGGCYLIVTRTETVPYLSGTTTFESSKKRNNNFRELKIVPFELICETRMTYLKEKVPVLAEKYKWEGEYWNAHLIEFENYLSNAVESKEFKIFIKVLDEIYGSNQRVKVQLMQICYHNFLREKQYPKRYQLIEQMCKGGYKYPPRIFYYDSHDHALAAIVESKMFDNIFMPVIFRFPFFENYKWGKVPHSGTYILAALRIIQAINAYARFDEQEDVVKEIPGSILLQCLNTFFRYHNEIIYALLEEFVQYGFIIIEGGVLASPNDLEVCSIKTTPKLNALYNGNISRIGKSIISDIAYLNLNAMRVPVNSECIKPNCPVPYFKAIALEDTDIKTWSITKIINTISLFRLINKITMIESNALKEVEMDAKLRLISEYLQMDEFVLFLKDPILNQLRKMISEMDSDTLALLDSSLSNYSSKLCIPR